MTASDNARADIACGHPRICWVGTVAVFPIDVPEKYLDYALTLPKVPLPCGCMVDAQTRAGVVYAKAYNAEIVHYLDSKHD